MAFSHFELGFSRAFGLAVVSWWYCPCVTFACNTIVVSLMWTPIQLNDNWYTVKGHKSANLVLLIPEKGLMYRTRHYENTPIQIYWEFYHQKNENFQIKKSGSSHISAQNIDCGYLLEPPRRGGSNEYPQSMFCIKVGFKWVKNYIGVFAWWDTKFVSCKNNCSKQGKRKVQGMPQLQTATLPRHQAQEETDKPKQTQM